MANSAGRERPASGTGTASSGCFSSVDSTLNSDASDPASTPSTATPVSMIATPQNRPAVVLGTMPRSIPSADLLSGQGSSVRGHRGPVRRSRHLPCGRPTRARPSGGGRLLPACREAAARNAIETAARALRDLRIAEGHRFDVTIEDGKVKSYGVRLDVSFKYGPDVTGLRADVAMSGRTPVASSHFL
jgi:dodecin